jgi:DNA-binding IclR family transcriptional regulator
MSAQGIYGAREGFEPGPATARLAQRYQSRLRVLEAQLETLRALTDEKRDEHARLVTLYAMTQIGEQG